MGFSISRPRRHIATPLLFLYLTILKLTLPCHSTHPSFSLSLFLSFSSRSFLHWLWQIRRRRTGKKDLTAIFRQDDRHTPAVRRLWMSVQTEGAKLSNDGLWPQINLPAPCKCVHLKCGEENPDRPCWYLLLVIQRRHRAGTLWRYNMSVRPCMRSLLCVGMQLVCYRTISSTKLSSTFASQTCLVLFFSLATDILSLDIECDYTVLSRSQEVTTNNNETCWELSQENAKHPVVTHDARAYPNFRGNVVELTKIRTKV